MLISSDSEGLVKGLLFIFISPTVVVMLTESKDERKIYVQCNSVTEVKVFPKQLIVFYSFSIIKPLADVFSCAFVQRPVAVTVLIIVLEGEGTERVTTNLRGNAARQGEGLSVVRHRTGDENSCSDAIRGASFVGHCFGKSLIERADCSVMHRRHA